MNFLKLGRLIELNGDDLRDLSLIEWKRRLAKMLANGPDAIAYSEHLETDGAAVFRHACEMGLEDWSQLVHLWSCVMSSPSIIPNDRLDRDFYLVLEDFKGGAAFRETDEGADYQTLITDLLSGQYGNILRVVAFNPSEGWSRDTSEDIARELEKHISRLDLTIDKTLTNFIEEQLGRKIGVQLPLPLA